MALSGNLLADFSAFTDACAKAVSSLKDIEGDAGKVEGSLNRVSDSLSGVKIVQQATIAAEAVDRIGGVSKLTDAELQRLGATAQEAAAKLTALGQHVPENIQALADAARNAKPPTDDLGKSWVLRIAEGQLLRDAVREVLAVMKEMALFLPELALKGAAVGDIEEAFHHLTAEAGLTADVLLGTLRTATHGTIDDFTLMQRVNKDLAAGLNLTDAQFGTLAQGAFALAKATGGSAKDALDSMSDAMVTGRTKAIALLTGKVDLKAAEDAYAAALGGTADQLTADQKLEADRAAILQKVETGLARVGVQQDNLDDKVEQGRVSWTNFNDQLGKAIAASPVVMAGFDGIRAALAAAFGTDQQHLIEVIVEHINGAAVVATDFAIAGVEGARDFNLAWSLIKTVVLGVEAGLMDMAAVALSAYATIAEGAAKIPFASQATKDLAVSSQAAADSAWVLAKGLDAEAQEAIKGVTGNSAFDHSLDALSGGLMATRDNMLALSTAHAGVVTSSDAVATATAAVTGTLGLSKADLKAYGDAVERLSHVGDTWQDTLKNVDAGLVADVQQMIAAGASAKDLAVAWGIPLPIMTAIEMKTKDMAEGLKLTDKIAADSAINWAQYFADVASLSASTRDQQKAGTQKWLDDEIAKHKLAKTDTEDFYNFVYAEAALKDQKIDLLALQADVHSREHAEKQAADDKAKYQLALDNQGSFSAAYIESLRKIAEASQQAADMFGQGFVDAAGKAIAAIDAVAKAAAAAKQAADTAAHAPLAGYARSGPTAGLSDFELQSRGYIDSTGHVTPAGQAAGVGMGPSFAEGGPTGAGGPATLHANEYVVPEGGALVMRGGGGGDTYVSITVEGSVIAERDFIARVSDKLTRQILSGQHV